MPKVSVIMPVYNGERFIARASDSILNQTFNDFELIIINDSSTDNTEKVVSIYQDTRIKLIQNQKNLGIVRSRNIVIADSLGDYISLLDADDIAYPTRLTE